MDDKLFNQLVKARPLTPNVPPFERQAYNDGTKAISPAPAQLRALAQNIIDQFEEHKHLRSARVLLLVEVSDAAAKKLDRGERIVIGRAYRSSPLHRVMTSSMADEGERKRTKTDNEKKLDAPMPGFDFIVKLNGNWLEKVGYHAGEEDGVKKALALIDHELLHCGVKIAGEYVKPAELAQFVKDLGDLHVETCDDIKDKKGRILIRYKLQDEAGRFAWKMRPHDLEEFCGVVDRWGAWDRAVVQLVDVIVNQETARTAPLLAGTDSRKAAKGT